jgi:hypothetical protein
VPCAAAIAVIMRFAIARYKASPLYRGEEEVAEEAAAPRARRRRDTASPDV